MAELTSPSARLGDDPGSTAEDRSACYRFLAALILDNPTPALLEGLSSGEPANLLAAALGSAGVELVASGLGAMRSFLDARESIPQAEVLAELSIARTRLFRGISGEFGPPPPYEALHSGRNGTGEGELLIRLQRFYREAGVALPEGYVDRADYLGLELDLMGSLCADEAIAMSSRNMDDCGSVRSCQQAFLEQHLLQWVPAYCQMLARESTCGYYVGAAQLLEGFLVSEAALFDTRRGQ